MSNDRIIGRPVGTGTDKLWTLRLLDSRLLDISPTDQFQLPYRSAPPISSADSPFPAHTHIYATT